MSKGIILSGGGSSGVFTAGLLYRVFHECSFQVVSGTSAGAINAMLLMQAYVDNSPEVLKKAWLEDITSSKSIFKINWFKALTLRSLMDYSPLRKLIRENIDIEAIRKCPRRLEVASVDLWTGKTCYYTNHMKNLDNQGLIDAIIASASIPFFFSPVRVGKRLLVDGGILENVPMSKMIRNKDIEEMLVILATPVDIEITKKDSINFGFPLNVLYRVLTIMTDQQAIDDLVRLKRINNMLSLLDKENIEKLEWLRGKRIVKTAVVVPPCSVIDGTLDFDPVKIRKGFDLGVEYGEKLLKEYKKGYGHTLEL